MANLVRFIIIAICFLLALGTVKFAYSKKDWACLAVAMAFTVVSDYFLLLTDNLVLGVATFWLVHTVYIFRVQQKIPKITIITLVVGLSFGILFVWLNVNNILVFFSAIYAALFLQNFVFHVKFCKSGNLNKIENSYSLPKVNRKIMLVALTFFVICDVNVLIFNIRDILQLSEQNVERVYTLMWLFYVPSQVLLGISAVDWRSKTQIYQPKSR
ncbi:MAG: lysoplasmalogenase family protein [Firmicutes bacterium]|nr:lysoplasmalogenase family protein [Bacillota bacterium]